MHDLYVVSVLAGVMQLAIACYALRLNRLFGTARVGWSLFSAFILLALLHLTQSMELATTHSDLQFELDVVHLLISALLLIGMVHIETVLKERARAEAEEQKLRAELEIKIQERTMDLIGANQELQQQIEERKQREAQVAQIHKELLVASRQAGMAEVANNVLHNVANVLNSTNISINLVSEQLKRSKVGSVARAAALMRQHETVLANFLTTDPKGRQLPSFLEQLAEHLAQEQSFLSIEVESLKKNMDHIKDIVMMQQSYSKFAGVTETVVATDLAEDALRMNASALSRHEVQIIREYDALAPRVTVEKHKVLQVLVNLIRNAKYACDEADRKDRRLTVRVTNGSDRVKFSVADNGIGIHPDDLPRIFHRGFSTRKDGHGIGLHSAFQAARDLGGALLVQSDGPGKGATFTLELPAQKEPAKPS